MKKLLHVFGWHQWFYKPDINNRHCSFCNKRQTRIETEPASGWGADYYWEDIN